VRSWATRGIKFAGQAAAEPASRPSRIPLGRLVTMAEIVDATWFLLTNTGVNAFDLAVDGGYTTT